MIRIDVRRWEDGIEITAEGHAGYGAEGSDIVCAAVSALLFGYLSYLCELTNEQGAGQVCREERDGYLWVRSKGLRGRDIRAFAVIFEGLRLVAEAYPSHVTLALSAAVNDGIGKGKTYE